MRAELARLAGDAERVVLVPHRQAHAIPWGMLVDVPVATVPSLAVLDRVRRRGPNRRAGAAVLGNPTGDLPHAETEAQRVADMLGCDVLLGPAATRAALEEAAGRVASLHIAAHAAYGDESPLDSYVKLHDGRWSAREALGARLDADLVFLSACETALAGALAGEELAGLVQAFLHAGARALVVSLWPVPDAATARLVVGFYERRKAGAQIADALAGAAASLRAELPHPWYWAAFEAVGDCA
jgi:CHAT domain-containing protein